MTNFSSLSLSWVFLTIIQIILAHLIFLVNLTLEILVRGALFLRNYGIWWQVVNHANKLLPCNVVLCRHSWTALICQVEHFKYKSVLFFLRCSATDVYIKYKQWLIVVEYKESIWTRRNTGILCQIFLKTCSTSLSPTYPKNWLEMVIIWLTGTVQNFINDSWSIPSYIDLDFKFKKRRYMIRISCLLTIEMRYE